MMRIGLTGGIGAGKSVASTRLAERGALVIDYDLLAREVVLPGTVGLAKITEAFGPAVLAPDGTLDRAALAGLVFDDEVALQTLNGVVHPEVARVAAEREAHAATADARTVVVHDIPLLAEAKDAERYHLVVVVDTPAEIRLHRLVSSRKMTEAEARSRIAAQVDDATRLALADIVLDGSGEPGFLREQVDELWLRLNQEIAAEEE